MVEFHKMWVEQCAAASTIDKTWGPRQALDYLVAEKFLQFIREAARHAAFADQLPSFAARIREMFPREAIETFLSEIEKNPPRRVDDDPVWAAEEVLAVQRARTLLLG